MKAQITAVSLDDHDRTVDMTVRLMSDGGTILQTVVKSVKIDIFSTKLVIDVMNELLETTIISYTAMPYSQAQIEAEILNLMVVKPGGPAL